MKRKSNKFPGLYQEIGNDGSTRFRILINHNKEIIQEYFYYGAKRSEQAAYKAALTRWKELRELYPVLNKRRFREVVRKETASGIPGVVRITTISKGHEYDVWKANWTSIRGVRKTKQFSVNKYGEKQAKRLAIKTRQEALVKIAPK